LAENIPEGTKLGEGSGGSKEEQLYRET